MVDLKKIEYEASMFSLLGQETRLQLLYMLRDGEKCLCEINPAMAEDQSVISRHLIKLREMGILGYRKEGVSLFYRIEDKRIFQLLELADEILQSAIKKKADELSKIF